MNRGRSAATVQTAVFLMGQGAPHERPPRARQPTIPTKDFSRESRQGSRHESAGSGSRFTRERAWSRRLNVKRRVVDRNYKDVIDAMYRD